MSEPHPGRLLICGEKSNWVVGPQQVVAGPPRSHIQLLLLSISIYTWKISFHSPLQHVIITDSNASNARPTKCDNHVPAGLLLSEHAIGTLAFSNSSLRTNISEGLSTVLCIAFNKHFKHSRCFSPTLSQLLAFRLSNLPRTSLAAAVLRDGV